MVPGVPGPLELKDTLLLGVVPDPVLIKLNLPISNVACCECGPAGTWTCWVVTVGVLPMLPDDAGVVGTTVGADLTVGATTVGATLAV